METVMLTDCTNCSGTGSCDASDAYGYLPPTDDTDGEGPECGVCSGEVPARMSRRGRV